MLLALRRSSRAKSTQLPAPPLPTVVRRVREIWMEKRERNKGETKLEKEGGQQIIGPQKLFVQFPES
jgi:hypothetical protein